MSTGTSIPLSVNRSAGRKIAMAALCVVAVAAAAVFVWLPLWLIAGAVSEQPVDVWGELVPNIAIAAFCLLVVYVMARVGYMMVQRLRYAAWLDGTVLAERGVVRVSRVDLATAEIDAEHDEQRDVTCLVARDRACGVVVSPPVTTASGALPAGELVALADAITRVRVSSASGDRALVVDRKSVV